ELQHAGDRGMRRAHANCNRHTTNPGHDEAAVELCHRSEGPTGVRFLALLARLESHRSLSILELVDVAVVPGSGVVEKARVPSFGFRHDDGCHRIPSDQNEKLLTRVVAVSTGTRRLARKLVGVVEDQRPGDDRMLL